jgi:hypothetical protein
MQMNLPDLVKSFEQGFDSGLDYEMLLSLAYLLGAWDRWASAVRYCEVALARRRLLDPRGPAHEGSFFLAVCLRMDGRRTAERYSEALKLLDDAQRDRSKALPGEPRDARYVKEKALLHFYWARVDEQRATDIGRLRVRELSAEGLRLSDEALTLATNDPETRAQIYNNRCFYYATMDQGDPERQPELVRRDLELLEHELRGRSIADWPINLVDTALVAYTLLDSVERRGIDITRRIEMIQRLVAALSVNQLRPSDRDDVRMHVVEARRVLPAGV